MLWRHLFGYLPVNIAQAVAGFGGIFLLTRLLTPEEYGLYGLAFALMCIFDTLVFAWLESGMARFYANAEARKKLQDHLATAYKALVILVAAACLISALIIMVLPVSNTVKGIFGFAIASSIVRSIFGLTIEARRAAREVKRYAILEFFRTTAGFGIGILLVIITDLGPAAPFIGLLIAAMICALFDLPGMLTKAKGGQASLSEATKFARYGIPISLSLVLALVMSSADRFLIVGYLDTASVGVYTAGYNLASRTLDIIFIWGGMAATPLIIAALEHHGRDQARAMARKAFGILVLLTFPAATGMALVATPLANVMIGPDFREQAALIIPWIAVASVMNGMMTYYLNEAFTLSKRTSMLIVVMVLPALLNIGLNMILLPRLGLQGAVIATVLAYSIGIILTTLIGRHYFPLPLPFIAAGKTLCACAIMASSIWLLPWPQNWSAITLLLAQTGTGIIIYAASAYGLDLAGCRQTLKHLKNYTISKKPAVI